jgi:hypothetical protein
MFTMADFYKIVQIKGGKFRTLFHTNNGTRDLPVGEWVTAEIRKGVRDGSGNRYYTSGLHVVEGLEETQKYKRKFKRTDRVIVRCEAEGLRRKEHSKSKVYLADRIKIVSYEIIN